MSLEVPELRTERLLLRGWRLEEDLDAFAAINAEPEVMRFIQAGRTRTRAETAERLEHWLGRWERYGFGLWAAELLEDGRLVGWVGLNVPEDFPQLLPVVEVGWGFDPAYWRRGLATEGGRASVAYAWENLPIERLISLIHADNAASIRVAEKLGMRDAGTAENEMYGVVRVFDLARPAD